MSLLCLRIRIGCLVLALVCMSVATRQAAGQTTVRVDGYVHARSGQPLAVANVFVVGTAYGDATDSQGHFQIQGIPDGSYRLETSVIGYQHTARQIRIKPGVTARANFSLAPDTLTLNSVTVQARRETSGLRSFSPSAIIINRRQIEQSKAQTVSDLLAQVPGIFIKSYGAAGAKQSISIRGSESNQVMIMLDGVSVNDAESGTAQVTATPLQAVERIEILKGSASAVFGSNAMAGVINIVTRRGAAAKPVDFSYRAAVGSFDSREFALQFSQNINRFRYDIVFDWLASDSDFGFVNTARSARPRQSRKNADFSSFSTFLKMHLPLGKKTQLEANGQIYDFDTGTPGEISNPTLRARSGDKRILSRLSLEQRLSENASLTAAGFYNVFDNRFSDGDNAALNGANRNISTGVDITQKGRFAGNDFRLGGSFRHDRVTGSNIHGRPTRDNFGFFTSGQLSSSRVANPLFQWMAVYPALRLDTFTGEPNHLSPKIGILFGDVLTRHLDLTISAGRSFRVPAFNSLFFISGVQVRNNPNLAAERSRDLDVGMSYKITAFGSHKVSATYYHRDVEGTVIWLPDFRFVWSPRNIDKVLSQGVELSYAWQTRDGRLRLESNYTLTDARFDLAGNTNPLPYRPRHLFNAELRYQLGGMSASWSQRRVSERFTTVAGTNPIAAYWLSDLVLTGEFQLGKFRLSPKLVVNNLLSADYQVVGNFPMPGREVRVSLTSNY